MLAESRRRFWYLPVLLTIHCSLLCHAQAQSGAPKKVDFRRDIYPILSARCYSCHKGAAAKSGYRLDLRAEILGETNGKPLVKIGQSGDSRLIHIVSGRVPGKRMPKNGKPLTKHEIALLRMWIDQGLVWDNALLPATVAGDHWSFRPVRRPSLPKVKNTRWARNPIDAFIAAKHEANGLTPAPMASRRNLIRRLSLDLRGLPPAPNEVEAYIGDRSPDAYDKLVERLLASPHYGVRWARHWLDVARWAESEGYESNHLRLFAWRYRDYVVRSFNSDKPFDRFIIEQIAGDELTPYSDENIIATGFLAAARLSSNEEDKWRQRNDIMVDIANTTSSAFLGLTMNCAQCHNHKFDPISTRDYYRFQGYFIQGQPANLALRNQQLWQRYLAKRPKGYPEIFKLKWKLFERSRKRLFAESMKKMPKKYQQALQTHPHRRTKERETLAREAHLKLNFGRGQIERAMQGKDRKQYQKLKKQLASMEKEMPARPQTFGFYSPITSATKIDVLPMKGFYPLRLEAKRLALMRPHILLGGEVNNPGPLVDVGWPAVFGPKKRSRVEKRGQAGRKNVAQERLPTPLSRPRLALAKWITSKKNPLTARVYVNRLWQYHFGRGIVATPGDFGKKGTSPTHPQLLDWLADEFMDSGWSTKHIHRLIVSSNTYRQSSIGNLQAARNAKIDPDNLYLWRWQPRRLEAEAIRDGMLAISGELDFTLGGPSVMDEKKSLRRSLYLFQKRDFPTAVGGLFDGPSAVLESCSRRHVSTVPLQALYLLNSEFVMARASALAKRVQKRVGALRKQQIDEAFLLVVGRRPDAVETRLARNFFAKQARNRDDERGLVLFCQALLNLNEFVYLE